MDPSSSSEGADGKAVAVTPSRRATRRTGLKGAAAMLLPGNVVRDAQLFDLSSDGLSVMSARPIAPGSRCTVSFELPFADHRPGKVSVTAKAVYSSYTGAAGFKVGLLFSGVDAATMQLLDEFLG